VRSLVLSAPGEVGWHEAPEPDLEAPGEALVRPLAVALCDLDAPLTDGSTPFPLPVDLGHEAVAEVLAVGRHVRGVRPGDRVVVPFQLSCGTCERCREGLTGTCATLGGTPMYGFGAVGGDHGGMLSDVIRVPYADAMLVPLPERLDPVAVASAADNIPDGWRTVAAPLRDRPGADVLILGGGAPSVGLYAVDVARALGAGRVDYVDADPRRRAVASDLGAEVHDSAPRRRYPITVDAGGTGESVATAARSTAPGGTCTSVGVVFEPETPMPLLQMYLAGVTFQIGRAMARPLIPAILQHAAAGRLHPERVVDKVVDWEDAPAGVLDRDRIKLVVARSG
jgi:threonine dehydrogenase-like Zn-dependent dehydrogenase